MKRVFIQGFRAGIAAANAALDAEDPPFRDFHDWVAARLHRRKNGHGWSDMLLEACRGNESDALERFWTELDAFRARSPLN